MKLLVTVILLLLTVGRIDATALNTGPLPDFCVKVEFGRDLKVEDKYGHWQLSEKEDGFELHADDVVITVYNYVYKEDEIIGFTWFINNKAEVTYFAAKYGTTVMEFEETFESHNRKGLSNVVWCVELTQPINEEDPEVEEPPVDEEPEVEEPPIDEEPEVEEPPAEEPEIEEPPVDEPEVEEPPVEEPEEENPIDEPEVEEEDTPVEPINEDDEDEPLPQTGDINIGLYASMLLLLGFMFLKAKV